MLVGVTKVSRGSEGRARVVGLGQRGIVRPSCIRVCPEFHGGHDCVRHSRHELTMAALCDHGNDPSATRVSGHSHRHLVLQMTGTSVIVVKF